MWLVIIWLNEACPLVDKLGKADKYNIPLVLVRWNLFFYIFDSWRIIWLRIKFLVYTFFHEAFKKRWSTCQLAVFVGFEKSGASLIRFL